jgi:hypothetical protein
MIHLFKVPKEYLRKISGLYTIESYALTADVEEWLNDRGEWKLVHDGYTGFCIQIKDDALAVEFLLTWG